MTTLKPELDKWELNRLGFKDKTSVLEVSFEGRKYSKSNGQTVIEILNWKILFFYFLLILIRNFNLRNLLTFQMLTDLQILENDLRRKILINCIP